MQIVCRALCVVSVCLSVCVSVCLSGVSFSAVPVIRSAFGKPLLDVDGCVAQLSSISSSHSAELEPSASSSSPAVLCACVVCLSSVAFSVSHHGEWLLLVGQRACGCHCRSTCAQCSSAAGAAAAAGPGCMSLLGCDVTSTDLPQRHAAKYERAWPAGERAAPPPSLPSLAAALHAPSATPFAECGCVVSDYLAMFASELSEAERSAMLACRLPSPSELQPLSAEQPLAAVSVAPGAHCMSAFAAVWSVKEAIVKAVGLGLTIRLSAIHTALPQPMYGGRPVEVQVVRPSSNGGCVSSSTQRQCSAGSSACCRSLDWQWQVDLLPVDARHTAAIARAAPTRRLLQHQCEHAAGCDMDRQWKLTTLASSSQHALSPALRLITVKELLAAVGVPAALINATT